MVIRFLATGKYLNDTNILKNRSVNDDSGRGGSEPTANCSCEHLVSGTSDPWKFDGYSSLSPTCRRNALTQLECTVWEKLII